MRITIAAVGRLKAGAERTMAERYLSRSAAFGRTLGIALSVHEVGEAKGGSVADRAGREAEALQKPIGSAAYRIVLDETGKIFTSAEFAGQLAKLRDSGRAEVAFFIGGADGVDADLRAGADLVVALGRMTWPHQLARLLLLEQIYRALAIIAGHPYHREG